MPSSSSFLKLSDHDILQRDRLLKTGGYYGAFICLGLAVSAIGPTLPALAENTGSKYSEIGLLFTAKSFGYLLGSFWAGHLYDRRSGHPLIALAIFSMLSLFIFIPLTHWFWILIAFLFTLGIAAGLIDVGGNTLIVWVHQEKVGPFLNGLHFFWGVGAFLSPLIIAWVLKFHAQLNAPYWTLSLIMLPIGWWLWKLPSPSLASSQVNFASKPIKPGFISALAFIFFLYVGIESGYGGWIYAYAIEMKLMDLTRAAYLTSVFWGALTLGRLVTIPLAVKLKPSQLLIISYTGNLLTFSMILIWSDSMIVLWVGTIMAGLSIAAIFPTLLALAELHLPMSAGVVRWFFIASSAGGMTIPWLIGQLFEKIHPLATMVIMFFDVFLAFLFLLALLWVLRRREKG